MKDLLLRVKATGVLLFYLGCIATFIVLLIISTLTLFVQ